MTNNSNKSDRTGTLKNISTRERWDWFHQAISYAKASNETLLERDETPRTVRFESLAS